MKRRKGTKKKRARGGVSDSFPEEMEAKAEVKPEAAKEPRKDYRHVGVTEDRYAHPHPAHPRPRLESLPPRSPPRPSALCIKAGPNERGGQGL